MTFCRATRPRLIALSFVSIQPSPLQHQAMADTAEPAPVPAPDAPVVTESDPTDAPNEEQQLEPTKKIKKIIRRKKRPARVQADSSVAKADPSTQSGLTWNIWYSKHEGGQRGDEQHSLNKPAPGRCSIARDSGYTRADRTPGAFFCSRDSKKNTLQFLADAHSTH